MERFVCNYDFEQRSVEVLRPFAPPQSLRRLLLPPCLSSVQPLNRVPAARSAMSDLPRPRYNYKHMSTTTRALQTSIKTSLRIDERGLLSMQCLMPAGLGRVANEGDSTKAPGRGSNGTTLLNSHGFIEFTVRRSQMEKVLRKSCEIIRLTPLPLWGCAQVLPLDEESVRY